MTTASFVHRFEPGNRFEASPLLLLHGTGGNESDLLLLGQMISPGSPLLSPRGQVLENGAPRFFRRFAEGVLDEDDLTTRSHALADFVASARNDYGIGKPIAVGYSNGANIAAAMLLLRPETLAGAVLMRAMPPFITLPDARLNDTPVLMLSGRSDPIVDAASAGRLATHLSHCGARVEATTLPVGHQLSQADVSMARNWIASAARHQPATTYSSIPA